MEPDRRGLQIRDHIISFQRSISAVERCPYPVIAAVHGIALGLSIDIMSACDIRYVASDALLSVKVHFLISQMCSTPSGLMQCVSLMHRKWI